MIPVNEPLLDGREEEYVRDCVTSGWISSAGAYLERFEKGWAAYCGRRFGVACSNGTTALELALAALDLPPEGEVILPSFTIVSCLEAVLRNGLVPVLVDCDPEHFGMRVEEVLPRLTESTVALMPVHLYGHPVEMEPLLALAARRGLRVVEDSAEAHGARCRVAGEWGRCGSFGDLSTFSFYANKNLTTGEGGMVLTDDEELAARLREKRNLCFGRTERFLHEGRGHNFRMTNLQAAVGCAQLERFDEILTRKRELAARYREGLDGLPLALPEDAEWAESSVWMYAVVLEEEFPLDAKELARELLERGIQTRPFFHPLHLQPVYRDAGLLSPCTLQSEFPVSERLARRGLYLPSGQAIRDEDIERVIEAVCALVVEAEYYAT